MQKTFYLLATCLIVTGCQSINEVDPPSLEPVTPEDINTLHMEDISKIVAQCQTTVANLYTQHIQIHPSHKKEFALAVGKASKACENLRHTYDIIQSMHRDKQEYEAYTKKAQLFIEDGTVPSNEWHGVHTEAQEPEDALNPIPSPHAIEVEPLT